MSAPDTTAIPKPRPARDLSTGIATSISRNVAPSGAARSVMAWMAWTPRCSASWCRPSPSCSYTHPWFGSGLLLQHRPGAGGVVPAADRPAEPDCATEAAIGAFAAVSYGVVILAALSLPETRGKQLDAQ